MKHKPSILLLFLIQLIVLMSIGTISLELFTELTEEVIYEKSIIEDIDDFIIIQINRFRFTELEEVMILISSLASWQFIIIISTILFSILIWKKYYFMAVEICLVTAGSILVNVVLKELFNRPRPEGMHVIEVISSSYPSGHSMTGMAVYGFFIYLVWIIGKDFLLNVIFSILLLLLIVLIGFSRVYLNVHYPSDVAGGFAAGLFWLALCIGIIHTTKYILQRKNRFEE